MMKNTKIGIMSSCSDSFINGVMKRVNLTFDLATKSIYTVVLQKPAGLAQSAALTNTTTASDCN